MVVAGPIGFTNGIFIVVGGTSVANHHVDSPRIIGMPSPSRLEAVVGLVGDHGRAGGDLAAVGEDADAFAGAAGHAEDVDAVLDGMVETQRELVGQRLHAQRREGRHAHPQRLHPEHGELVEQYVMEPSTGQLPT